MATYIALLRKDAGSDYSVDFPDFPGCVTAGTTMEEARVMAEEALAWHIETMLEGGDEIPAPSLLDEIMADPHNRDAVAFLVTVPAAKVKAVRVNITLPEDVLGQIDRYASDHGFTRSGFLVQAARRAMREEAA